MSPDSGVVEVDYTCYCEGKHAYTGKKELMADILKNTYQSGWKMRTISLFSLGEWKPVGSEFKRESEEINGTSLDYFEKACVKKSKK